jgi:hypothetical protein
MARFLLVIDAFSVEKALFLREWELSPVGKQG